MAINIPAIRGRRWASLFLAAFLCLLLIVAVVGVTYQSLATRRDLAATRSPGTLVDVGGHRLHLWCTGAGVPPVILETGLGGSTADWGFVQPEIAKFTRVCSYDRAGMGFSDPGPSPRTARRIARELAMLLARGDIQGPVLLVGASIGGFPLRVFASERANDVAGLVLVDASHEDQAHEIPGLARFAPFLASVGVFRFLDVSFGPNITSLAPSVQGFARATRFRAAGYRAAADEIIHVLQSASEVRSTRRTLSIPVVVVTGARGLDATWRDLQRDLVAISTRGCQVNAEESGHMVAIEQPKVLIDAIRTIVDAVRDGRDGPAC